VLARTALALGRAILFRHQVPSDVWGGRYDTDVIMRLANCLANPSQVLAKKYSSQRLSTAAQNVEFFLQSQALENEMAVDRTPDSGYGSPSTPHKPASGYGVPIIQHGCITPPITPENEGHASLACPPVPSTYPSTPSPVPSHYDSGNQHYYVEPANFLQVRCLA